MEEEAVDGLTYEIIEEHELFYTRSNQDSGFTHVNTDTYYDDGYEYWTYVYQEDATLRFFAFDYRTNSWDTEPLSEQELNIRQVYPREVTKVEYFDEP